MSESDISIKMPGEGGEGGGAPGATSPSEEQQQQHYPTNGDREGAYSAQYEPGCCDQCFASCCSTGKWTSCCSSNRHTTGTTEAASAATNPATTGRDDARQTEDKGESRRVDRLGVLARGWYVFSASLKGVLPRHRFLTFWDATFLFLMLLILQQAVAKTVDVIFIQAWAECVFLWILFVFLVFVFATRQSVTRAYLHGVDASFSLVSASDIENADKSTKTAPPLPALPAAAVATTASIDSTDQKTRDIDLQSGRTTTRRHPHAKDPAIPPHPPSPMSARVLPPLHPASKQRQSLPPSPQVRASLSTPTSSWPLPKPSTPPPRVGPGGGGQRSHQHQQHHSRVQPVQVELDV